MNATYDVFISHASEDKEDVARPLAEKLTSFGLNVWFDDFTLEVGDSLVESIDRGLASSKFGVAVLSQPFLRKGWPRYELRGLTHRDIAKGKALLPIWHEITAKEIELVSPTLADKFALDTSRYSLDEIALLLIKVIRPDIFGHLTRYVAWLNLKRTADRHNSTLGELRLGPIRHQKLPEAILVRARLVYLILEDVIGISLPRLIESFQRDLHPEEELRVWERIAVAYLEQTSTSDESPPDRQWVFGNLLHISMQTEEYLKETLVSGNLAMRRLVQSYAFAASPVPERDV